MKARLRRIVIVLIVIVSFIAGFYWNEARKEIVFLCGNFEKGGSEHSVIRQLDTGNLLRYHTEKSPMGKRIVVDSYYNLWMYQCIIEVDLNGNVKEARLDL
jgi:hypothetical protein